MNSVAQIIIAGHNRANKNVHSINNIMVIKYHYSWSNLCYYFPIVPTVSVSDKLLYCWAKSLQNITLTN